jgi:hypothetical protein
MLPESTLQTIFKGYNNIIYDTNCIIYYVFKTEIPIERTGERLTIEASPFTQLVKDITNYIRHNDKKIITLKIAFDEITLYKLAEIVHDKFSEPSFVGNIATKTGPEEYQRRKPIIEQQILRKVTKDIKRLGLGAESWFSIDSSYSPVGGDINNIRGFFSSLFNNSTTKPRFNPLKNPIPSDVDLKLILFSKDKNYPLISNDGDITEFRKELTDNNYTHKIIPLMELG